MKTKQPAPTHQPRTAALALGALGVVFGDIGTSPLYALRQCLKDLHSQTVDPSSVLGILSLIVWSLVLVVCVKYATFIIRADHEGEGGTLAMLALIQARQPRHKTASPDFLVLLVLFGSALLYGDGVITPSISVLSAVEGLKIAAPGAQASVIPLSLGILVGLFLLQRRGTGQVGNLFGPIMAIWFLSIAVLGVAGIAREPQVLEGLNPALGLQFLFRHGWTGVVVLGAVVLCFSGAEALFADLSHFGRVPIRLGWYGLVLPSLVLNYFGQGALLLQEPAQTQTPFFALVPHVLLYPMVGLATVATVIASQALISGAFSLTQQAIHMGYFPRFEIVHTSKDEGGQVYIAAVNYALMIACIAIVLGFRSSEKLGGAYGLAVIGTMTITSITYLVVLINLWKWPPAGALALAGFFLIIDLVFLLGNVVKIFSGAWVPLLIALVVFAVFRIWIEGRIRYRRALDDSGLPLSEYHPVVKGWKNRHGGTGVFFTTRHDFVPLVGQNAWLREHVRHEQVILVTIEERKVPYIPSHAMIRVEALGAGFWHVTASFGFMQHPDVTRALKCPHIEKLHLDWERLVCYLPAPGFVCKGGWRRATVQIYEFLGRNSLSAAAYFRVPPREIITVGLRVEW